jgi:glycyl-tRNA synthetase beta chain
MVYEFTELQGIMGQEYAIRSGEKPEVALAIAEHYMPRNASDALPKSMPGTIVALADKMDSIAGAFAIGIQPTGSADPYGLRRQALGISNIILSGDLHIDLDEFINAALVEVSNYAKVSFDSEKVSEEIKDFFVQRVRNIFLDKNYKYDVIDAVLADNSKDLVDSLLRVQTLQEFKNTAGIQPLLAARNRASNLSKKTPASYINVDALTEDCEKALYEIYLDVKNDLAPLLSSHKYKDALELLLRLNSSLESFFDGVMVMVDDPVVRDNRLSLLKAIAELYDSVADMGRLVE